MDHDLQVSPVAATIDRAPGHHHRRQDGLRLCPGRSYWGALWKTPVGKHNGHDDDSALALAHKLKITFPYTYEPAGLGGVLSNIAVGTTAACTWRPTTFPSPPRA